MKNKAVIWLYIMIVFAYVYALVAIVSLIFIPLGIYAIYGASFYTACTKLTDSELYLVKQRLTNWAIFFGIFMFPIGLIGAIIAKIASSNNVKVSEPNKEESAHSWDYTIKDDTSPIDKQNSDNFLVETEQKVISEQDMEKFEQLKKYKEQGLITEEEFLKAKNEIFK